MTTTEALVKSTQLAIDKAWKHESQLPAEAAQVRGRISPKIRHLLNNLCSRPDTVYLECGCWEGASVIAALAGNEDTVRMGIAVDNWSQYDNPFDNYSEPEKAFDANTVRHLGQYGDRFRKIKAHYAMVRDSEIPLPLTVCYYDADHQTTCDGCLSFFNHLEDPCVFLLDDWNRDDLRADWRKALRCGDRQVVKEWVLPAKAPDHKDTELWWDGFYVAVLTKKENWPCGWQSVSSRTGYIKSG
jgi:hypothetical protein